MNSRSTWLNHTREYLKQDVKGRKYFRVHKNNHDQSPFEDTKHISNRTIKLNEKNYTSMSPTNKNTQKNPQTGYFEDKDLTKQLLQKDTELRLLRQLYKEANQKLRSVEKIKVIENNLRGIGVDEKNNNRGLPQVDSFVHEKSPNGKYSPLPELNNKRNQSTPNVKSGLLPEVLSHSIFKQHRYTKNRPKIVFGNPITGIITPMI
ncbi:hypothetical protein SteCoe_12072 [Stentor coeruleus]|uniref:Uncharacterized protein n=1 Tax=Stentor coeruleus TaxID=5963 RepID=A0A1R2CBL9_9CILI|nr:hypothetical protein SteCoe_12072 [Stentor coeruleus]